jgi:hypothetical protein
VEVWCPIIPFIDMDVLEGNPIYLLTWWCSDMLSVDNILAWTTSASVKGY